MTALVARGVDAATVSRGDARRGLGVDVDRPRNRADGRNGRRRRHRGERRHEHLVAGADPGGRKASCRAPAPDDTATQCRAPSHCGKLGFERSSSVPSRKLPLAGNRSALRSRTLRQIAARADSGRRQVPRVTTIEGRGRSQAARRARSSPSTRAPRRSWCRRCGTNRCRFADDRAATAPAKATVLPAHVDDRRSDLGQRVVDDVADVEDPADRFRAVAASSASTTSSTYTQSRRCAPSPKIRISSPSNALRMKTGQEAQLVAADSRCRGP